MLKLNLSILLIFLVKIVTSKINIDIISDSDGNISVNYTGIEINVVSDSDVQLFGIDTSRLKKACKQHYGRKPSSVYVKSPTPWGDLYTKYKWEQVTKVLSIKSAKVKRINKNTVTISSQNFDNLSNKSIKVNTGITNTVENTITSTWSEFKETALATGLELDFNFIAGNIGITNTLSYGKEEEKSESVTIGSTTGVETELQPGQSVTAVLSASVQNIEIEVVYKIKLRGNLAVNFKKAFNGHHFWGPDINEVMVSGGIDNDITTPQTIKCGYYSDAALKVFDKVTGKPV